MTEGIEDSVSLCKVCGVPLVPRYKLGFAQIMFCPYSKTEQALNVSLVSEIKSDLQEDFRFKALKELRIANFVNICRELIKLVKDVREGLEIGSAYGWFLDVAKNNGLHCIGIEPEEAMHQYSAGKGHEVVFGYFPEDFRSHETFDFIIFNDVFEHLPDPADAMKHCGELIKPNGILIINLPLNNGMLYKIASIFYRFGFTSPLARLWQINFHSPHLFYYNRSSVRLMVEGYGFKEVKYHRVKTLTFSSTYSRLCMDSKLSPIALILLPFFWLALPVINLAAEDTGCCYFRKDDC